MRRRYCPPTSNNAFVICPSEQQRTASISTRMATFRQSGESLAGCCFAYRLDPISVRE